MNKLSLFLKVVLLFFILIFIKPTVYSQSHYKEGIVITNEADTLFGFIDSKGEISLSKECYFKKDLNSEYTLYQPFSIQGFRFTKSGRFYISKQVQKDEELIPMFVEYVLEGIVDLYYYRDAWSEHYLIDKKMEGQELVELSNELKIVQDEYGNSYSANSKKYIGILTAAFMETPSLFPVIQDSRFDRNSFTKVTKQYHSLVCEDGEKCIIYEKKENLYNSVPGLVAGVGYNHIEFITEGTYKILDWENTLTFSYGFDMNHLLGFWSERLFINTSLLKVHKTLSSETIKLNKTSSDYLNYDFITNQLSASVGIGYSGLKEKFQPYIQSGISFSIGKVEIHRNIIKNMDTTPEYYDIVEPLHNMKDRSIYFKTGINYFLSDRLILGSALQGYYSKGVIPLDSTYKDLVLIKEGDIWNHQYGLIASIGVYYKL